MINAGSTTHGENPICYNVQRGQEHYKGLGQRSGQGDTGTLARSWFEVKFAGCMSGLNKL